MLVARGGPGSQTSEQPQGTDPSLEPEAFFLEGAPKALGIGMILQVVITGKDLVENYPSCPSFISNISLAANHRR